MARIKSPHVVQVHDHGVTAEGVPYMVMELLEGETLGSRLQRLGALPLDDVVRIVVQTGNALSSAHALGIIHRDIKPDNLFLIDVGGELFIKVLDFGIAKQPLGGDYQAMTETGRMMGTPFYMSPEQMMSAKHVDHRTDVWALAVVGYEALTGKRPFQGESIYQQAIVVHAGGFKKPSSLRPGLPEAVDAWAVRALHREQTQRFGSTRELAHALESAVRRSAVADMAPLLPPVEVPIGEQTTVPAFAPSVPGNDPTYLGACADCPIGGAVITPAGRIPLPTRFILHAVGPVYVRQHEEECAALLRSAYVASLRLAEENNIRSVAFPAIGTGACGYPVDKAALIALAAAMTPLAGRARSVELIVFVLFPASNLGAFAAALTKTPVR